MYETLLTLLLIFINRCVYACVHVYICSKASRVEVSVQLVPSTISVSQDLNSGHLGRKHLYPRNHFVRLHHLKNKNKPL